MSKLGLAPVITATKAPKHYGTSCESIWEVGRDRGYPKIRDMWEEVDRCKTMQWFIYMVSGSNPVVYIAYKITTRTVMYNLG
jgi:hypothetical protein